MHEHANADQRECDDARRGAACRRSASTTSRARPGATRGARTRRAERRRALTPLATCSATSVEEGVLQARVAACRPCARSSSSVPSAISRPPAMTPMRSAMRSATSRMCVVMMTVPPARDALAQHVLDLARGAGVEAGQRLVEDDQPRVVDQRAGERHLLPHALGEALAALVRVRRKPEPVDQLVGARLGERRLDAPEAGDEFEIFERRQLVVDHRLVGHPGHDALGRDRIGERVDAEHRDRARVGPRAGPRPCAASWSCRRRSGRAGSRTRRRAR